MKGDDDNHSSFTFSFNHIQLETTVTCSLDADITIDIEKSIRHSIKRFGAYCPHLQLNIWKKGGAYIPIGNNEIGRVNTYMAKGMKINKQEIA